MARTILMLALVVSASLCATPELEAYLSARSATRERARTDFGSTEDSSFILVSIRFQRLFLYEGDTLRASYPISSSEHGEGNVRDSYQTPLGFHRIRNKVGNGAREGTVFRGLRNTGEVVRASTSRKRVGEDVIVTRVLVLDGLEYGRNRGGNVDSFSRYIFIHGTPEEGLLGEKASNGCIRMQNGDVIELFNRVSTDTVVYIGY